jgi:hypothetical protein
MSETPGSGGPQITWNVQVERSTYWLTYHVVITNLTSSPVRVQGRYAVLAV